MKHLKIILLLVLFTSGVFIGFLAPSLRASPPLTTLNIAPTHAPEGSTVSIALNLTGYTAGQKYNFTIQVTDPLNHNATAFKVRTVGSGGTINFPFSYPSDFSGSLAPTTNLNGTYVVRIIFSNATAGSYPTTPFRFTVGPTDLLIYQTTMTVNIFATGYTPNSYTPVNITQGGSLVFNRIDKATPTGIIIDSWKIPASATFTTYVVTVDFRNSTKPIRDVQTITIVPAVLSFKGFSAASSSGISQSSFSRGSNILGLFTVQYPDGTPLTTGTTATSTVVVDNPSNVTQKSLTSSYNSTASQFITTLGYSLPVNATLGSWILRIAANSTVDTFGNRGPDKSISVNFTVGTLTLKTSITALKTSYNRTVTFNVNATVSYPISYPFNRTSGVVFANLTSGTATPVKQNLTYVSANKWTGSLTIPQDFPLGSATLQVSAHDNFGNTGTNTTFQITINSASIIVRQVPFSVNGTTFTPFQTLAIQINASYFNNKPLILGPGGLGKIAFNLPNGRFILVGLTLQANGTLTGQYMIRETDPLGAWNLTISAGQLNDGNGNINSKSFLGPIVKIASLPLTFDSSYFRAPGNKTVTGDKVTLGAAFRYPNGTLGQNLIVNGTTFANGQNMTFTFSYDTGTGKYLTTIDTTGWAPGQYQINVLAYSADYRGSQIITLVVGSTPFLLGPVVGALLIIIILAVGALEYRRRRGTTVE